MARTLLKDIKKSQHISIILFAGLIFLLFSLLVWRQTSIFYYQRLQTITKMIEAEIQEHPDWFSPQSSVEKVMQKNLDPFLHKIIRTNSFDITVGFYSRSLDRVIIGRSNDPSVNVTGMRLTPKDPGRQTWITQKPRYVMLYSKLRHNWIIKYDKPIIIEGQAVGHAFANITLSSLITFVGFWILSSFLLICVAASISIIISQHVMIRIKKNLNNLLLYNKDQPVDYYYEEFKHIASINQEIYNEVINSRRQISIILESITDAFYVLDRNWCFTYINKHQEQYLTGRKKESHLGKCIWELYPELVHSPVYTFYHKAADEQRPVHFQYYYTEQSRWFEVSVYPSCDGISVYSRDISDRKEAEKRITHLAFIVESSEDAIISLDLKGIILSWNSGASKIFGYQPHEILGKNIITLIPEDDRDRSIGSIQRVNHGEPALDWIESTRICRNGTPVQVSIKLSPLRDETNEIIGICAIHRNITGRLQAESALAAERERLAVTLDSIGDGVIAVDQRGEVILINQAGERMTCWDRGEAIGQPLEKVFYVINDLTSEAYEHIAEDVQVLASPIELEKAVLVTKDLQEIKISCNCSPIKSQLNRSMGVVIVFQDISERIQVEAELLKAEKLESLGVLAGGIAHDFNNILAASMTNLQLALVKLEQKEAINSYLQETMETIYKASHLTKQLLTFSKGGSPVKKAASIGELLVQNTKFILRGAKVKSRFFLPDDLWAVEIDEGQISQVINNLVLNAKQAMPRGGFIDISAVNCEESNLTGIQGKSVKITIADQGTGIPKEIQSKIFDPFFTTKSEGTGLGLSTSYSIIKRHGGLITFDSKPEHGTVFSIFLPASTTKPLAGSAALESAASAEGLKILLMDDEEAILFSVGELLTFHLCQVEYAKDGQEAILKYLHAKESGKPFDVTIMDLTIPGGMGGQETMAYLRDFDPKIKAIVSSGYANDPILADYERYGFSGVVAKPFTYEELMSAIHSVIMLNP